MYSSVAEPRIDYYMTGNGPILLFLHGLGVPPHYYKKLFAELSREYTVIAPFLFGVARLQITSVAEGASAVQDFCAQLKISPNVIVGHSYGGAVALLLKTKATVIALSPPKAVASSSRLLYGAWRKAVPAMLLLRGKSAFMFETKMACRTVMNLLSHPRFAHDVLQDLSKFSHPRRNCRLICADKDDIFSRYEGAKVINGYHDWPIYEPSLAAKEILKK